MRIRKTIIGLTAVAALAVPGAAMAAAPNGQLEFKTNANSNGSQIGQQSSQIKQNGQFVSGNGSSWDQTTYPGSRADLVQSILGH